MEAIFFESCGALAGDYSSGPYWCQPKSACSQVKVPQKMGIKSDYPKTPWQKRGLSLTGCKPPRKSSRDP